MDDKLIEYKRMLNVYIKKSILKPYLIHVEFELENIHTKLFTDRNLKELMRVKGYSVPHFISDIKSAIQKIRELQEIFREFNI